MLNLNYQILFYVGVGLILYLIFWKKKGLISSILNILNYLGIGILFYGILMDNFLYGFIGTMVMLLSILGFFIIEKDK